MVCHTVYHFALASSLLIVYCNRCWCVLASAMSSIVDLKQNFSRYPVVVPSIGDPEAMILLDQSLHILQQVIDGVDFGVGQVKTLDVCLSWSAWASAWTPPSGEGQGQLSHAQVTGACSSTVVVTEGKAQLSQIVEGWGLYAHVKDWGGQLSQGQ